MYFILKEVFLILAFKTIFYISFIVNLAIIFIMILFDKKRPEKTLAWILILMILPPVGLILFIFLGRNWKVNTLDKKSKERTLRLISSTDLKENNLIYEYKDIISLVAANSFSPLFMNNEIKILDGGINKFDMLKKMLNEATDHIHLEYYIVKNDGIGNEIKNILIKKANEGVKVRFIIDKVGSIRLNRKYIKDLRNAGVEVALYSYVLAPFLRLINTQINYRNHRKIVVIDSKVGFLGGINIGDEYIGLGKMGEWKDCHIMIEGDCVLGLQSVFLDDFSSIKKYNNEEVHILNNIESYFKNHNSYGNVPMQIIKSGPDSEFPSILQVLIKMISTAKKSINIITPYFIPSESLMDSLKIAILSGVIVSLIFPEKADHFTVNRASKTYLAELQKIGAKIYFYKKNAFIHSKLLTIDEKICTIGTANLDIRSFELNYEINSIIYNEQITKDFNNLFKSLLENCSDFNYKQYENRSTLNKLVDGVSRLLSSIL
ncbi:cardiolipin synthase [Clostridium sp. AL.422]|uniref:cardiolipin synthase n=1 Tax=Clostridium TaxID=1485 RepID=UPI00293DDDDD|nr:MULTISPECIES: cardiolipin synthase [unclassified Clostridium]MDV4152685.1 cardiolipin synthase [Clostridium sp. AL.422]